MTTVRAPSRRPRWRTDVSRRSRPHMRTLAFVLCMASTSPLTAQTTLHELWPQLNVYWKASNTYRFYLLTRVTMVPELGYSETMIGFHADYLRLGFDLSRYARLDVSYLWEREWHTHVSEIDAIRTTLSVSY